MNKFELCKEIGECFGDYWEKDGKYFIDNGDEVFEYKTPEALLEDWADTLVAQHISCKGEEGGNWEKEVRFIYNEVLNKMPNSVRASKGKKKTKYKVEVYTYNGQPHGKMVYLGVYENIIDAIEKVWKFKGII